MRNIINIAIQKLNKNSSLDDIKSVLLEECKKANFSIDAKDWGYMFDEVMNGLKN